MEKFKTGKFIGVAKPFSSLSAPIILNKTPCAPRAPKSRPKASVHNVAPENCNGPILGTVRCMARDGFWSDEPQPPPRPDRFERKPPRPPTADDPVWKEKTSAKRDSLRDNLDKAKRAKDDSTESRNLWQTTAKPEGSPDLAKPRNGANAL